MKRLALPLAFAALWGCSDESDCPGGCVDGGADGSVDAGAVDGGGQSDGWLEECPAFFEPDQTVRVGVTEADDATVEYEMEVLEASEGHLVLNDPERPFRFFPQVEISFPVVDDLVLDLPEVGDTVLVRAAYNCGDSGGWGYVRVMNQDHEILWEGGNPNCDWPPDCWFRVEPVVDSELCWWRDPAWEPRPPPECCCLSAREERVVFRSSPDTPLLPGTVLTTDLWTEPEGARFVVFAQGAYVMFDGPCTSDFGGPFGSAYLARIAE